MGGIIWLASYPKSGNTWTRVFLENLLTDSRRGVDINAMSLMRFNEADPALYRQVSGREPDDLTPEETARLRPRVQALIARSATDSVFAKTHCALLSDRGTPQISMDLTAAAVYIVRNPLDVAVSNANYFDLPLDRAIELMGSSLAIVPTQKDVAVHTLLGSWTEHVRSWTREENSALLVLRYEDLVSDPVARFGRLAEFLGLNPNRARLERAIKASSFHRLRQQERRGGFLEGGGRRMFRTGRSGQWREVLSDDQVRRIVDDHGEQMKRHGYSPD